MNFFSFFFLFFMSLLLQIYGYMLQTMSRPNNWCAFFYANEIHAG